jgi:Pentapeptide repeats (8 copies)
MSKRRRDDLLYGSADPSPRPTGIVSRQNYLLRSVIDHDPRADEMRKHDSLDANLECETTLAATREAIRKNWENLRAVNLKYTDLSYALFYEADLKDSLLTGAYLRGTMLRCANLSGVDLTEFAVRDSPDVSLANIQGVRSDPNGFLDYANAHGAIELSDDDWQKWKHGNFDGYELKKLIGPAFPAWAEPYIAKIPLFCAGRPVNRP